MVNGLTTTQTAQLRKSKNTNPPIQTIKKGIKCDPGHLNYGYF
jgi:hypothetical protein